jgi:hypothetical protein
LRRIGIPLLANCASPAAPQLFVSTPERVCRNTITTIFASCTLFHLGDPETALTAFLQIG